MAANEQSSDEKAKATPVAAPVVAPPPECFPESLRRKNTVHSQETGETVSFTVEEKHITFLMEDRHGHRYELVMTPGQLREKHHEVFSDLGVGLECIRGLAPLTAISGAGDAQVSYAFTINSGKQRVINLNLAKKMPDVAEIEAAVAKVRELSRVAPSPPHSLLGATVSEHSLNINALQKKNEALEKTVAEQDSGLKALLFWVSIVVAMLMKQHGLVEFGVAFFFSGVLWLIGYCFWQLCLSIYPHLPTIVW